MKKKASVNGLYDENLLKEVSSGTIRASVIVSASVLDRLLEELLKGYFVQDEAIKVFDNQQPLGNFSAKISMAYCLGLISKEACIDLNSYRKIRNYLAHELVINEEIERWIKDICISFNFSNKCFTGLKDNSVQVQVIMEFVALYVLLIKKINRISSCEFCQYEYDNLGFDESDYEFMKKLMI